MQKVSFIESLEKVILCAKQSESVQIRQILKILSKRGIEALLIVFSIPIPIPGISNLFGLILAFLGVQFAFGNMLWLPKWISDKKINSLHLEQFTSKTIDLLKIVHKVLHPRLTFFVQNRWVYKFNGILICLLALIVALPIPIPFTNILFATPILAIALGLLNDDGLFVLIGYCIVILDVWIIRSLFHFFV